MRKLKRRVRGIEANNRTHSMRSLINWLTAPVYIEHVDLKERINVNANNYRSVLNDANKYHNNWLVVTRLQSWL